MMTDALLALLRTLIVARTLVADGVTWTYADGVATAVGPWCTEIGVAGRFRGVRTVRVVAIPGRYTVIRGIENRYCRETERTGRRLLNTSSDGHRVPETAAILGTCAA